MLPSNRPEDLVGMASLFRKYLSAPGLIKTVCQQFSKIADVRKFRKQNTITLKDHLMSGLAVFGLKCPSLLDFERKRKETATEQNLRKLYHVEKAPCDTYLRERLDEVDPESLRPAFKKVFASFQRGKGLEDFEYIDGHVLMSADGTGLFSSSKVSCPHCCEKKHKDGTTSYYHQMLGVVIVHPDKKNVIPLCPEIIVNKDGNKKNDCERNASKRFIENFRREHPHLKAIVLGDGLTSNAPNIRMLEENNLKYILVAKPGDHKFLFDRLEESKGAIDHEITTDDGCFHQFKFMHNVSLNKSNQDLKVNVLEYRCTDSKGKEYNCTWVTNITLSISNVLKIAKAGRARWKVENETFNTLKKLGYEFEHNYGHGKKYLSTIFCMLMMLAFLIDQVQEVCCSLFQRCKKFAGTNRSLWESMRSLFRYVCLSDWETFYLIIVKEITLNSS